MKDCGIEKIDMERKLIEKKISALISEFRRCKSKNLNMKAKEAKKSLSGFRMKLAYNRGTEALESYYGWSSEFAKMIKILDKIIKSTD
jgi:hypothetical protein